MAGREMDALRETENKRPSGSKMEQNGEETEKKQERQRKCKRHGERALSVYCRRHKI